MRVITFLILISLFTACATPNQEETQLQSSFILFNVNGYSLDSEGELFQFEAIAIEDGIVLETGAVDELREQFSEIEHEIDGNNQTLLPGLIDAHVHVMGLGIRELDVNLAGINSLEETLDKIEGFAEENPNREWITGRGWNQVLWEGSEFPAAEDLDQIVSDKPVYLTRVDGHAAWANSKALELAGIDDETTDPQGGVIHRDENGKATGILIDTAMRMVSSEIPERSGDDYVEALELAIAEMSKFGLTSVHDAGIGTDVWNLYKEFADQGKMNTRIYAMISGTGNTFDELSENGIIPGYANDLLSLRSVKISADGALGSRGAAMIEDYHDDPGNKGLLFYDQDVLNEMVLKGASKGYQINVHAIGDAANRQVLDAYDYVFNQLEDQAQDQLRHRVEHAQVLTAQDIPRFLDYNLIASMQPTHATSDMNMAEDRVGSERILSAYAWQTFLDQGTIIAGGSDFPVEDVNPFYGLYSAVTRQDHEGMPPGGWYNEQKMSRIEALKSFTLDAAFAAHQEDILGTLEPGKWADFIVIDQDYFEMPASDIWKINVLETYVAGKKVYGTTE